MKLSASLSISLIAMLSVAFLLVQVLKAESAEPQREPVPAWLKDVKYASGGWICSGTLVDSHEYGPMTLPAGTRIDFKDKGSPDYCVPGADIRFHGFVIPAGCRLRFRNLNPWHFDLPEARTERGLLLPAHSTVFFRAGWETEAKGVWHVWLGEEMVIQGRLCKVSSNGCGTLLYPNGRLRAFKLHEPEEVEGIPCTSSQNPIAMPVKVLFYGLDCLVWLHPNGHLQQVMLSRDCTIKGKAFHKGDLVRFTPEGDLDPNPKTVGSASRKF